MIKHSRVILVSFVILFLELLLIRLISTEIRIFSYFSNLLLLGMFVGSGLGMLLKRQISISITSILLLLVTVILVFGWMFNVTEWLGPLSESFFWFQSSENSIGLAFLGFFLTLFLFFLIIGIFIPLGQILGNLFEKTNKLILVYSINVVASLAGMWLFQTVSVFNISLFLCIIFVQILLIFLTENKIQRNIVLFCLLLSVIFVFIYYKKNPNPTIWSPYQKLTLLLENKSDIQKQGYVVQVNNVGYMGLTDLSSEYTEKLAEKLKDQKLPEWYDIRFMNQYNIPFLVYPKSKDVLIIGSGGGNDIAGALRADVSTIDAVEIDPGIIHFGKTYHPERPYDSPKVTIYNDDGRSFLKRTEKKYDVIILGLADSHTVTSSQTNVRLDHYLYTKESFEEIKQRLKPGGIVFLSFEVGKEWIGERIQKGLLEVFGEMPVIFHLQGGNFFGWGGFIFMSGAESGVVGKHLDQNPILKKFIKSRQISFRENNTRLTDDWPYLYLDQPRIPQIHFWISLFLIFLMFLFKKLALSRTAFNWDFFFLGAGFLLFEFQNISKTSLLFGNTWVTNLFTITFILIFILLANFIQAKKPLSLKLAYICLFISLVAQFFVPLAMLNSLSMTNRVIFGSLFLNLPFLFSGMIFITKLKMAPSRSTAFASNLLGGAVGGILEIFSFLLGIQSLLIFSVVLYVLSIFSWDFLKMKNIPFLRHTTDILK